MRDVMRLKAFFLYFEDKSKQKFYHKVHSIASPEVLYVYQ